MLVAIYLSLLNFDFQLLEVAKVCGATPWRAFWAITWPLNWIGTAIGIILVVVPTLAATVTPRFLGGPNGALYGNILEHQFGATGTWALGSAMGVVLFVVSLGIIFLVWRTVEPQAGRLHRQDRLTMAAVGPGARTVIAIPAVLLGSLYLFLYFPIGYVAYLSLMENSVWPFPPVWTLEWYAASPDHERLPQRARQQPADRARHRHSVGAVRHRRRHGHPAPSGAPPRSADRALRGTPVRGPGADRHLDLDVQSQRIGTARQSRLRRCWPTRPTACPSPSWSFWPSWCATTGASTRPRWCSARSPMRTFFEVTLPNIWPAVLGAFLVSFILGFNNFEISFYNLGAVPTLPTVAWGTLRHGIEPELYALATLVNLVVLLALLILYLLIRTGFVRLGVPGR